MEAWCSGLTRRPVKPKIAGSNPVASAELTLVQLCESFSFSVELWYNLIAYVVLWI